MSRFQVGDTVRIDIPNQDDPDYQFHHRRVGEIVEVLEDAAGKESGDERDSVLFTIEFRDGESADFRWRDLRPASNK